MVDSVYQFTDGTSGTATRLMREVGRLHVAVQRATTSCCGGKTTAQCHVLGELSRSGALGVVELSRRLGVHKAWTSRTMGTLEREGFVTRRRAEDDGRAIQLALTPAGRARWRSIDAALNARARAVLDRVPRSERAGIERALEILRDALVDELRGLRAPQRSAMRTSGDGTRALRGRRPPRRRP